MLCTGHLCLRHLATLDNERGSPPMVVRKEHLMHVYTVEGTAKEISDYKETLYERYGHDTEIDAVSTPFDTRLSCAMLVQL